MKKELLILARRGETIANLIIELLKSSGIDISYCGSQTYDGAGNMVGKQNGASLNFKKKKKKILRMIEHYIITAPLKHSKIWTPYTCTLFYV